jgi:chemotaxis-related protein WspD
MKSLELFTTKDFEKEILNLENKAVDELLHRDAPSGYIEEWTKFLINHKNISFSEIQSSVLSFRLADEWLAIPTKVFKLVSGLRSIHKIPHRNNTILRGIVNMRGQIRLCVSLQQLLEIPLSSAESRINPSSVIYIRMLAIEKEGSEWVFEVDEVYGIHIIEDQQLENVPVTVMKSTANYLSGVFEWEGKTVGLLDEELLFYSLKRSIS